MWLATLWILSPPARGYGILLYGYWVLQPGARVSHSMDTEFSSQGLPAWLLPGMFKLSFDPGVFCAG